MPTVKQQVHIKYGTQAEYDAILTKDPNTIYFTTDTSRVYVGSMEHTRHITLFESKPEGKVCAPESLFIVKSADNSTQVYYSADGYAESAIVVAEVASIGVPGSFGPAESKVLNFGESFDVPNFTINDQGKLTQAGSAQMTLPDIPNLAKEVSGSGNAITAITVDGQTIIVVKGKTFVEISDFDALSSQVSAIAAETSSKVSSVTGQESTENGKFILIVNEVPTVIPIHGLGTAAFCNSDDFATSAQGARGDNAISRYGDAMEGPLIVQEPTELTHAATKQYVDEHASGTGLSPSLKWGSETHGGIDSTSITLPSVEDANSVNELTYVFTATASNYTFTAPSGYILSDDTGFAGLTSGNSVQYNDLTVGSIYEVNFKVIDTSHIALIRKEWSTT